MPFERYRLSFGTCGLLRQESLKVAELYLSQNDWSNVRKVIKAQNTLQYRTASTSKRRSGEIIARLKTLSETEVSCLVHENSKVQGYILWIAACRCYRFIADFATEVIRDRFTALKSDITYSDFDLFYDRTSLWHPELSDLSQSTRIKLRQILFKMMREAEIIDENNQLIHALSSPAMSRSFARDSHLFLPILNANIRSEREYVGY